LADLLPRLALDLARPPPAPLARLFPRPVDEVWLEIGFGAGEHLAWQAKANPAVGLIGCEPFVNGVAQLLGRIEEEGLGNVRLHAEDALPVIDWLPAASLGRVFILFPDPWPKARHHKRRLVAPQTLARLARVMRPGAQLRLATDIGDYARASLMAFGQTQAFEWLAEGARDWRERPPDWPRTRYEAKAIDQGRKPVYLTFLRR
jgi:tRNA (guanine-N7-)-methyltransferase